MTPREVTRREIDHLRILRTAIGPKAHEAIARAILAKSRALEKGDPRDDMETEWTLP